jgi:sulfite exporter TauE/SafE
MSDAGPSLATLLAAGLPGVPAGAAVEWPLLVGAGMLGSAHCLGMCGPFALAVGAAAPGWSTNLRRQACYSAGRIFTYAVLGAVVAFCGLRLARALPWWTNLPAVLAMVAGGLLAVQGLAAAGMLPRRGVSGSLACPGAAAFKALLGGRGLLDVFLAGLFTGLLPCGLLYGMLALAASTGDVARGLATMVAFGMGTVPAMVAAGLGGSLLGMAARRRIHGLAAWCLVLTGCISIARGAGSWSWSAESTAGCPFCTAADRGPDSAPSAPPFTKAHAP